MIVPWKKLNFTPEYAEWVRSGRKTATTRLETDLQTGDIGWDAKNKVAVAVRAVYLGQRWKNVLTWFSIEGFESVDEFKTALENIYGKGILETRTFAQIFFQYLPGVDLTPADNNDGWFPVGTPEANALKGERVLLCDAGEDEIYLFSSSWPDSPGRAVRPLPPPYKPPHPWDVEIAQAEIATLIAGHLDSCGHVAMWAKMQGWKRHTGTREGWIEYCKSIAMPEFSMVKGYKVEP